MGAMPATVPADGVSTSIISLSGIRADHPTRFLSSLSGIAFSYPIGTVDVNGQLTTTIRSTTPGAAIITAQDLTTGETFPASASVTFTAVEGQPSPPPVQVGDIVITNVRAQHPLDARYLQGIPVSNRIDVTVDWKGTTPARVDFILNGTTFSQATNGTTSSHTFDMGADLRAGSNSLRIVAVNAAGQSSQPMDFAPWSTPMPVWMIGLQQSGLASLPVLASGDWSGEAGYELGFHLPPYAFDIKAPGFGVPDGETKLGWEFSGKLSIPLYCMGPFEGSLSAGAEKGFKFLGAKLEGKVTGSMRADPIGLCVWEVPQGHGSFQVEVTRNLYRKPVLVMVAYFNAAVGVFVEQTVVFFHIEEWVAKVLGEFYIDGKARIQADSDIALGNAFPYFQFSNLNVGGGLGIEGGYRYQLPVVEIKVWAGADGMARFARPGPITWPPTDNWAFDSITLTGEAGAKFRAGWFEREAKGSIEWKYPPTAGVMASGLRDLTVSDWRLIGHAHAPDYATFRAAQTTQQAFASRTAQLAPLALSATTTITSVLVSNVYTYPEPSLAVQPVAGDALLLWVHDDIAKPVGQAQEIAFSRWDGSAWSVPAGVTNDDKLDGAPQVAWAAGGAGVAVWPRLNATLPITATFDVTTAKKIEIATAVYSTTLATWSPVSLLTNNAALDMTPHLARNAGGKLLAAWRQNDAGLLSGTVTDTDRIVTAFYDAGWSAPTVAVNGIPGLVDLAAGYGNGAATIAFTRYLTPTGSLTPTLQLFTASWNGAAWAAPLQRTDDSLGHTDPQVVYNAANQPLVIWLAGTGDGQGQALSLRNLTSGATVTLTLPAEIGAIDEFRVVQDAAGNLAAVFTSQATQRDLFVAFFDQAHGVWGNPARLTDDRASEAYPAPGLDPTGRLLLGYAATAITPVTQTTTIPDTGQVVTYTLPTEGQTDLVTLSHEFVRNLTLTDADFTVSDDHPAPGATVVLSAMVRNSGDLALDGVAVSFYDGDPDAGGTLIATQVWPTALAAGFTATFTTTYTVPTTGGVRDLYARVDPVNAIAEANEADNTAHLAAFGPDLALIAAGTAPWGGSDVGLVTVIRNLGTTTSPTTTVAFYGEEAGAQTLRVSETRRVLPSLVTDTLPPLAAGATYTLTTPWNYGALPEGSYALTATVNPGAADFTEVVTANNTTALALPVRPDLSVNPLYVWAAPLPDGTMVVTAAVSNFGSVAALPAVVDIYVDAVFSDTARLRTLTLPALAPASQIYVTATWDSPTSGEHTFYVVVNADRSVAELTWANNVASAWAAGPLTDLRAAKDGGGAALTWTHGGRGVARYEVYRSTNPYFAPGDADAQKLTDVPPPAAGDTVSYTDADAFTSPTGGYFYVVVTVDRAGLSYLASNRVGAFSFELTPGAP